jgi:hypothetical protein
MPHGRGAVDVVTLREGDWGSHPAILFLTPFPNKHRKPSIRLSPLQLLHMGVVKAPLCNLSEKRLRRGRQRLVTVENSRTTCLQQPESTIFVPLQASMTSYLSFRLVGPISQQCLSGRCCMPAAWAYASMVPLFFRLAIIPSFSLPSLAMPSMTFKASSTV